MPGPVSRTVKLIRVGGCSTATMSTDPRSVNFRALVVRFSKTRRSARAWPSRRSIVRQLVAAAGQLDRIARERAQAERGTVDQPELALLALVHRARALLHQRLREEQDRRERGAQVVHDLHQEIQPVGPSQLRAELLRGVVLQRV